MENPLEIYQSIVEDAVDSIFIGDSNSNFILVNKSAEILTGYNRDELLTMSIKDLFSEETLNKYPLKYDDLNSGSVVTKQREIVKKNGDSVPVEMKSKRLANGNFQSIMRDNSEKLKKEKELKESEEKYKVLFESSPSGILFATSDGTIINANSATHEIFGFEENELIGKNVSDLSHADNRKDVQYNIERILSGEILSHVVKSIKKDGTTIFNLLYEKKVRINEYGDCILSIANDITKQIIAENKLKEIEEIQRNILEHSNNVFYAHTADHKITYISPQIKHLLGYEPEEAMIKWTEMTTANPLNEIGYEKTLKAISTGIKQDPYELELRTKDGKEKIVEVNEAPVLENGETISIVGALIDLTSKRKVELELKEAKEQFQFAIEGSDVGLWDWQVQTGKTVLNEKCANIIGYTLEDLYPLTFETWINFIHPEDIKTAKELLNMHFKGVTSSFEVEFRMKHKSGEWVWVLARGKVVEWNDEKKPVRMVGTHLDITNRKRVDEELRNSETRFRTLFEDSAVPIWVEDFSQLKKEFDKFKYEGIKDFRKYFDENPKVVESLAGMVKILDVNKKSLELYNVSDKETLIRNLLDYFSNESLEVFKDELVALAEGKEKFESELPIISPSGEKLELIISLSVPSIYSDTLERVLVSFVDITERKQNTKIIRKYAQEIETLFSLSQNMIRNLNSDEILKIIPEYTVKAMENVNASSLWKINNDEKVFEPISWYGYEKIDGESNKLSLEELLIEKIYKTKKGIILNDSALEPIIKNFTTENSLSIKSTIVVPLIAKKQILGIVFADNLNEKNIFDDEDLKVLQSFANISAVALNNAMLYDEIKKSEHKYRSIVDSIGESILIHDFETGMIKDVNKKVLEMYGVGIEEALNLGPNETSSGIYPFTAEEAFKMLNKAKTEGPQLFEWHAKRKNGELFWTEVNLRKTRIDDEERILAVVRDIDERKKIEEAIKISEAKSETIMRSAPVGLGFIKDRVLEYVNENLLETLGYSKEEMIEQSSQKFYETSDEFERLGELYSRLEEKNIVSTETRLRKKNGDLVDVIISISSIDKRDSTKGVIFSVLDITENKIAQQKLLSEQARYKSLFENSPVPLWEADFSQIYKKLKSLKDNGIINIIEYLDSNHDILFEIIGLIKNVSVNKATLNLLKIKNNSQLNEVIENNLNSHAISIFKEIIAAVYEDRNYFSSEGEIQTIDEEIRYIDIRLYVEFDNQSNNNKFSILLATIDITARKKSEKEIAKQFNRNKLILNTMNDGFIFADDNGDIKDVNPAYCNLVGYTSNQLLQMNIRELEVSIPKNEVDRRIKQMVEKGFDSFETKHKAKNGNIIDLAVNIAVNLIDNKTFISAFVRDITLQNKTLEELKNSREEISELAQHLQEVREEERQTIAAEIHDDLGQSLTALKLDTSILLNKISSQNHIAVSKLKSMKELADQSIKTIQKISSDLRPGILDDLGLTAALEWEINKFEERTGIKCTLKIIPENISFDKKVNITVFRLVQESCTNVARHSKATELNIIITLESNKLYLVVKDNGIGITVEQANDSKSFGLFGMRERVRNLGGGINFVGTKNKGTSVNIVLPIQSEKEK